MLFRAADSICVPKFRAVLEAACPYKKRKTIPQRLTLRKRSPASAVHMRVRTHIAVLKTARHHGHLNLVRTSVRVLGPAKNVSRRNGRRTEMKMANLNGLKVAILVTDGFEQVELVEPRKALDGAGAQTQIVSPKKDRVRGWKFTEWGDELPVDVPLENTRPDNFDALLLPGGVINPDKLRMEPKAVAFVNLAGPKTRTLIRTRFRCP
jgi:hypothetical protein